jgi:predicted pyridoxine 5'-phosphate oxidase superfamily flavin-nucleotide-binding protein
MVPAGAGNVRNGLDFFEFRHNPELIAHSEANVMTHSYAHLMFSPGVKEVQSARGSRSIYARLECAIEADGDRLTPREAEFITARDSFYMATATEGGWPYVQHRGGPPGFLKVVDDRTIGFADFRGNRQYISVGNLSGDGKVALFLMDYANRRRLKLIGHARVIERDAEPELVEYFKVPDYDAPAERVIVIRVEAFDWNCPQYITPRYTAAELRERVEPMIQHIEALEAELERLRLQNAQLRR